MLVHRWVGVGSREARQMRRAERVMGGQGKGRSGGRMRGMVVWEGFREAVLGGWS